MSELAKVDPKEFGLEENQVSTIEQAFLPKIQERDGYLSIYGELIKKEITPQTEREAKELRLKLVKIRTGIAEIHKTQKAFFLAAGRFVDAWKNKETAPIEQMEENLQKIENYSENIRKEKIAKLEAERKAKRDVEIAEQQRKEAEEKARIEAEKKAAKAPDKVKLQNYINSISIEIPVCKTKEAAEVASEISAKFTAFKKWANSQIEQL